MNFSWLKLIATHRSSKNYLYICSVMFSDFVQRTSHGLEVWREKDKNRGPQYYMFDVFYAPDRAYYFYNGRKGPARSKIYD